MVAYYVQLSVSGVSMGAIYALVALGYTVTYVSARVVNFAQGELVMLGAMVFFTLGFAAGAPFLVALLGTVAVLALVGVAVERVAVAPVLARAPHGHGWIISTIGLGIVLQHLAILVWGKDPQPLPRLAFLGHSSLAAGGVVMSGHEVWTCLAAVVVIFGIDLVLERTYLGSVVKAVAVDADTARLVGIPAGTVAVLTFAASAVAAALAGVLLAPLTFASPFIGLTTGLKAFAAAVLGGLGSIRGALVGGLILGLVESIARGALPFIGSGSQIIVSFVVLVLILLFRPTGLFGRGLVERV